MALFGPSKKEKELQAEVERLKQMLSPEHNNIELLNSEIKQLNKEKDALVSEIENKNKELYDLNIKMQKTNLAISQAEKELVNVNSAIEMQEFGVYKPNFVFANSDLYKDALSDVRERQKKCIKDNKACTGKTDWQVNGSASKGKAMVRDTQKLLLRAFNVECDDIVNNVKISNFDKSVDRIYKISDQISKLGNIMSISITQTYINLKIEEVKLALDFQQKKQEEKELLKELRQQQREEAKVQKEIEAERKKLFKEQSHYQNALAAIMAQIATSGETPELAEKKAQIEAQLEDTAKAIEDVDYREANKRAGYVYIISNIGAFGENVYKIGMTRRLDPHERVDELGDASVPFNYDIHAMIFTDDAPSLETALHNAFEKNKVNKINSRREFFNVSLDEIKEVVRKNFDKTVEWIDIPEAEQYRQSLALSQK